MKKKLQANYYFLTYLTFSLIGLLFFFLTLVIFFLPLYPQPYYKIIIYHSEMAEWVHQRVEVISRTMRYVPGTRRTESLYCPGQNTGRNDSRKMRNPPRRGLHSLRWQGECCPTLRGSSLPDQRPGTLRLATCIKW